LGQLGSLPSGTCSPGITTVAQAPRSMIGVS
jgi:hypothetical protein